MKLIPIALIFVLVVSGSACKKGSAAANTTSSNAAAPVATASAPLQSAAPAASPQPTAADASQLPPATAPAAPVPAELPKILAHVNNEDVTKADFDRLLRNIELGNGTPVPAERRDEIYRKVLDELVTYTLLKQEARARKIEATDAEVDQQLQAMRAAAKTEEAFRKELAARKMTLEGLKADAKTEIAIAKMMKEQVATTPEATDADAKVFYDKNPERFQRPETVRASHILLLVDPKSDEATKKQTRTKIDDILKRAKSGEDFATLAQQNSQDGSAAQGGDLGYFPKERMVPAFSEVAFALKPGEVSDVVTTQFGVHIIKVTDRKPAGAVPLEEVSPRVKQFLTEQKKQEQAQAFIAGLRQKAKIEVLI